MCLQFMMQILIVFVCLLIYLPTIKSDCLIKFNKDIENVPRFEKNINIFKIKVPIIEAENVNYIRIYNMESVTGWCGTYFSPIICATKKSYYYDYYESSQYKSSQKLISNQTVISLNCLNDKLYLNDTQLADQTFSCEETNWSIYTTKQPYSWCQKYQNSSTFLFAAEGPKNETNILAAFCYNMDQLSLQTFVYNKTYVHNYSLNWSKNVGANEEVSNAILDENLWNFKTTMASLLSNDVLQETLNEMAKKDVWLDLANYEKSLLVQEDVLAEYLKGYEGLFNVVWWRPLRLGNWKYFQNTLAHYAQSNSYELYVGTSGVAQYPTDDKCNREKYLELKLGFQNGTVPAYIWTFLKSNDESNKDFVIVGYNSPFAEYFTVKNIIFCPDICKDIPWLKEVSSTFRYAYAGIMFCCSTDFIRQNQYLQGFPMDALRPTVPTTTTVAESLEEEDNIFFASSLY